MEDTLLEDLAMELFRRSEIDRWVSFAIVSGLEIPQATACSLTSAPTLEFPEQKGMAACSES